ncbi:MAG TPA: pyridoxamine 5'-phosphate oxidase, partial [Leeuwenhoekiella sp.]|nr:pyridoxamine 5'-phosphate oxidase [Leeuwenhoekiella sp.]
MGKKLPHLNQQLQEFIDAQKIFFVGTAAAEGRVNISPKGMNTFYILNEQEVLWLNLTG